MTLESIPAYIRRRAAEGASYGDVAHELAVSVQAVMFAAAALGVELRIGMHPAAYDGKGLEDTSDA